MGSTGSSFALKNSASLNFESASLNSFAFLRYSYLLALSSTNDSLPMNCVISASTK